MITHTYYAAYLRDSEGEEQELSGFLKVQKGLYFLKTIGYLIIREKKWTREK
jgi:hypothetical protein